MTRYRNNVRYSEEGALLFLVEFSMLLEADYMIGTFNLNADTLAAVLRACPVSIGGPGHDDSSHYANTYGVDRDDREFR